MSAAVSEQDAWVYQVFGIRPGDSAPFPDASPSGAKASPPEAQGGTDAQQRQALQKLVADQIAQTKSAANDDLKGFLKALGSVIVAPEKLVATMTAQIGALLDEIAADLSKQLDASGPASMTKAVSEWRGKVSQDPRLSELRQAAQVFGTSLGFEKALTGFFAECDRQAPA